MERAPGIALSLLAMLALGIMLLVEPRLSPQAVRTIRFHPGTAQGESPRLTVTNLGHEVPRHPQGKWIRPDWTEQVYLGITA